MCRQWATGRAGHETIRHMMAAFGIVLLTTAVAEAQRKGATIHVVNRDGTELRDLLPDVDRQQHCPCFSQPCWSPDGRQIACNVYYWGATPGFAVNFDPEVMVTDTTGGGMHVLGDGSFPDWSPNGRHLAFTSNSTRVVLMNTDGSGREDIVRGRAPVFSPTGDGFLYSTESRVEGCAIPTGPRFFDLNSGKSHQLDVNCGLYYRGISYSPDGRWIIGARGMSGRGRQPIFVSMDPEDPRIVRVTLVDSVNCGPTYAWSPDGKTILCAMTARRRRRLQIYSFQVPDLDQTHVTVQPTWFAGQHPDRSNFDPAWSPDGARIAFVSTRPN